MKKIFILMAICAFVFASCGGSKTPSDTVKTYFKAIQSKNFNDLMNCFDMDAKETDAKEMKALEEKFNESSEELGTLKSYEILSEEISEDGATATVKATSTIEKDGKEKTEEQSFKLNKVNEEWKIDLGK
jgi:uncharacterized protein YpuA (DUF1002 family)